MSDLYSSTTPAPPPAVYGGRVPPQNTEAEQSVLGTILLKDQSLGTVLEILVPDNFYRQTHKLIFEAMIQLFERNEPQDLITVTNQLKNNNKLDEIGGAAYLAMLTSMVPVTANLAHYARIIRQKAILRNLIQVNTEIASRCYDEQGDIDTLVDEAEQAIFEIASSKSSQDLLP